MNDEPQTTSASDSFEELLQLALHARASSKPRDGLALRVLAHVEREKSSSKYQLLWRWTTGPVLTILLVAVTLRTVPLNKPSTALKATIAVPSVPVLAPGPAESVAGSGSDVLLAPPAHKLAAIQQQLSASSRIETRDKQTVSRGAPTQMASGAAPPRLDTFPSHEQSQEPAFGTGPALNLPAPSPQAAEQIQLLRAEQALPLTIARLQIEPLSLSSGEKQ